MIIVMNLDRGVFKEGAASMASSAMPEDRLLLPYKYDQIVNSGFCDIADITDDVNSFLEAYRVWQMGAHPETPYSGYLCGNTQKESNAFKAACKHLFTYTKSLGDILPGSTFVDNNALKHDCPWVTIQMGMRVMVHWLMRPLTSTA